MITLLRMIRIWQLKTKWKLALWQFVDESAKSLQKEPELLAKKIMPYLAEMIHNNSPRQSANE